MALLQVISESATLRIRPGLASFYYFQFHGSWKTWASVGQPGKTNTWQAISQHDNNIKLWKIIHQVLSIPLGLKFTFCPRSAVSTWNRSSRPSIDPSDPLLPSTPAVSLAALVRAFYRARGPSSQLTPRDSPWCQQMYSVNLRQALLYSWPPVGINIRLANNLKLQKLLSFGCASKTHKVLNFNDYLESIRIY